jgi:SAM-dependent methyltransferase
MPPPDRTIVTDEVVLPLREIEERFQPKFEPEPETGPACPACGRQKFTLLFRATDRLYATTAEEFTIVECAGCKLIRMEPQPDLADLYRYYPDSYWFAPGENAAERLEEIYRRFVLGDHVRFVQRALENSGESGPILDVGCGGGLFLRLMADQGVPVLGLDISEGAAHVAWHVNAIPTMCGKLPHTPLPPGSCAVITMFHLLEHLYDPAAYLEAARDLLKPEGRLVLQVPNAACWQFLLFGDRWNGLDVPRHLFDFKQTDIDTLLRECGFEPVRYKHFSLRDNPAGLATTLAPSLDPMARRVRRIAETPGVRLGKNLAYFALLLASLPFTVVEATCRAGSTIMVEARKRT